MTQEASEAIRLWLTSFSTPIIACFGAWIAWQQHNVQKYRLTHDVSERRIALFNAVRLLVVSACSELKTTDESLLSFQAATIEMPYLFKDDTVKYVEQLEIRFQRMLELRDLIADRTDSTEEELKRAQGELRDIRKVMRSELSRIRKEFRPYFDLSDV